MLYHGFSSASFASDTDGMTFDPVLVDGELVVLLVTVFVIVDVIVEVTLVVDVGPVVEVFVEAVADE